MSRITRGTLKSYDALSHRASVQLMGSLSVWLDDVPVDVGIPGAEVLAGRECAVVFFTDDNPNDAAIVSIHGAVPAAAGASSRIQDADNDTHVETDEGGADPDTIRFTVASTLRFLLAGANPHATLTGDMRIDGSLGLDTTPPGTSAAIRIRKASSGATGFLDGIDNQSQANTGATGSGIRGVSGLARVNSGNVAAWPVVRGLEFRAEHNGAGLVTDQQAIFLADSTGGPATNKDLVLGTIQRCSVTPTLQTAFRAWLNSGAVTVTQPALSMFYSQVQLGRSTITRFAHYDIAAPITFLGGNMATEYGYFWPNHAVVAGGPFWEEGIAASPANNKGNRFRSNSQFGSATGSFGSGDGVIGIANAPTAPTVNPVGGGILYAAAGALLWRGSAGTVTVIAPA